MLEFFRKGTQSWTMKIILGAIILVFAFFGVGNLDQSRVNVLAEVEGEQIFYHQYDQTYRNIYNSQIDRNGGQISEEDHNQIRRYALDIMINTKLVLNQAKNAGLNVPDLELAEHITSQSSFQEDGRYRDSLYQEYLQNLRLSASDYEQSIKDELLLNKFQTFISDAVTVNETTIRKEAEALSITQTFKYLELTPNLFVISKKPTAEELKTFYDSNTDQFQSVETYDLDYFILSTDDFDKTKIVIKERQITSYYEDNQEQFTLPAGFKSKHILIRLETDANESSQKKAEKKANNIYKSIKAKPELFASLAKKYSDDTGSANSGGGLGWAAFGTFVPEYEEKVKTLQKGELSTPVKSAFGYHVILLEDTREETVTPQSEVAEKIKDLLFQQRLEKRLQNLARKIEKNMPEKDMLSLAQERQKDLQQIVNASNENPKELTAYADVFMEIQTKNIFDKGLYQTPGGKYVVYELKKITPPELLPFKEVQDKVTVNYKKDQQNQILAQKVAEYARSVKTQKDFDAVITALNKTTKKINAAQEITVRQSQQHIPGIGSMPEFSTKIFDIAKNQKAGVLTLENRNFLISLGKKGTEKLNEDQLQETIASLKTQKERFITSRLVEALRRDIDVSYNKEQLKYAGIEMN